ncbi:MAG: sulfotransferase [Alphaproteobacteria bacterium]|nr:sulfotransferase [Alphaproteobacteria bacterium]
MSIGLVAEKKGIDDAKTPSAGGPRRLPDFIIGGAPKCGTSSIHFILNQHADIALPEQEVAFFDSDEPVNHADFFHLSKGDLQWFDPEDAAGNNARWYASRFQCASDSPLIGEDSTTYIYSEVAAARIAKMLPDVKLIFMLRHPVERAYSQYWHIMNTGRTSLSFEKAITQIPAIILGSSYLANLKRFMEHVPQNRIKVVIFEDFVANQQATIDELTDFLGASRMSVSENSSWYNRTYYPISPIAQRGLNLVGQQIIAYRYRKHMQESEEYSAADHARGKAHYWYFKYINPLLLRAKRPPPMRPATRDYLLRHLSRRNAGLSELLGRDLSRYWKDLEV